MAAIDVKFGVEGAIISPCLLGMCRETHLDGGSLEFGESSHWEIPMSRGTNGGGGRIADRVRAGGKILTMNGRLGDAPLATYVLIVASTTRLRRFLRDDSGAAGIEYGLIVTGIAIAILSTIFAIGTEVREMFEFFDDKIEERIGTMGS